jgi:asparagine synthase (glutamine-hydrolysing)
MLGVYYFHKENSQNDGLDSLSKLSFTDPISVLENEDYIIHLDGKIHTINGSELSGEPSRQLKEVLAVLDQPNYLELLDGIFSLVVFRKKDSALAIHNNRYTCHKVYYHIDEAKLLFSNSIKNIVNELGTKPTPHLGSIRSFISNGFTICDQTQITGIKKLLPSFSLTQNRTGMTLTNHWQNEMSFARKNFSSVHEKIKEYKELYQKGLRSFLKVNEHKKIGTLLSGGNDTSWVLANLKEVTDKPIHAYTTTFPGWAWNEESYAKNVSEKFGAKFHPQPFEEDNLDGIIDLIKSTEEPVVGSSLPLHFLAKKASKEVDVMLGGDGGDTLWGEYYPVAEYHRYVKHLPLFMRKLIHKTVKLLVKLTDWERFWELEHVSSLFTKENYYDDFMRTLCTYRHFNNDFQEKLFSEDFAQNSKVPSSALEIRFTKENFREALIEGKLFNAFYTYQSFHTYKSMESSNLPLYFPTIQKDVINFITTLPYKWVNGGTTFHRLTNHKSINRRLHKKALSSYLRQDEIYNRSFDMPWYKILKPRRKVLELLQARLINRGWFKSDEIISLFSEFQNQKVKDYELLELKHHGYRIFTLLSLEIWCMLFLDQKTIQNQEIKLEEFLA